MHERDAPRVPQHPERALLSDRLGSAPDSAIPQTRERAGSSIVPTRNANGVAPSEV
jgi:hypothetical protein